MTILYRSTNNVVAREACQVALSMPTTTIVICQWSVWTTARHSIQYHMIYSSICSNGLPLHPKYWGASNMLYHYIRYSQNAKKMRRVFFYSAFHSGHYLCSNWLAWKVQCLATSLAPSLVFCVRSADHVRFTDATYCFCVMQDHSDLLYEASRMKSLQYYAKTAMQ